MDQQQVGVSLVDEQSLKFIEFRLFWEEHVKRSDVMERFGLWVNQT